MAWENTTNNTLSGITIPLQLCHQDGETQAGTTQKTKAEITLDLFS